MKLVSFALNSNLDSNQKLVVALQDYTKNSLQLSQVKRDVLASVFKYAEEALTKPQTKKVAAERFASYNEIIMALDKSDLEFLDTVIRQVGERQNFVSGRVSPTNFFAKYIAQGSRFSATIAPVANHHRKAILANEATWLLGASHAILVLSTLAFVYIAHNNFMNQGIKLQTAQGNSLLESVLDNYFSTMLNVSIPAAFMMAALHSVLALTFSSDIVGWNKTVRNFASTALRTSHNEGVIRELPEVVSAESTAMSRK